MPSRLSHMIQLVFVFTTLGLTGAVLLCIRLLSFGLLTEFNRTRILPLQSKLVMFVAGMKMQLPESFRLPDKPTLITFNHNSYLDIFILTAPGFPRTRFLLSEKTLRILPFTLGAIGSGVIYIPEKKYVRRRLRFFKRLADYCLRTRINIAASSEGVHNHHHGIDKFNRGIYHLALASGMDIQPLFINIPKESNPFNKYRPFARGTVSLEVMPLISTRSWTLEHLDQHISDVRDLFVQKFNQLHHADLQ